MLCLLPRERSAEDTCLYDQNSRQNKTWAIPDALSGGGPTGGGKCEGRDAVLRYCSYWALLLQNYSRLVPVDF